MSKHKLWRNSMSNCVLAAVRLVQGILLTRWSYGMLGKEYYGFYSLLWMLFIYVLLLDFGCGKAAQKYTAEELFKRDPEHYNRVIGTVFWLYSAMALVIVAGTLVAGMYLDVLTRVSDAAELAYLRRTLLLFGVGCAVAFPFGVFGEILTGLHKMYWRNNVLLATRLLELIGSGAILFAGGKLIALVSFVVGLNLLSNLAMMVCCFRLVKTFRLRLRFSTATFRELANFSFFAYLAAVSNLVLRKTDQLVLGIFLGLDAVGAYQLGSRLPLLAQTFTGQYQEALSPVCAECFAMGEKKRLNRIVFDNMRICSFLGFGILGGAYLLTPEMMRFFFNVSDPEVNAVCRLLLVSVFLTVAFRSVAGKFLLMAGHHRLLGYTMAAEAAANLGLSLYWVRSLGINGVIYGTILPNAAVALFVVLPVMIRSMERGVWRTLTEVYFLPMLCFAPMLGWILWVRSTVSGGGLSNFAVLFLGGAVGMLIYAAAAYFVMLRKEERSFLKVRLESLLRRRREASVNES